MAFNPPKGASCCEYSRDGRIAGSEVREVPVRTLRSRTGLKSIPAKHHGIGVGSAENLSTRSFGYIHPERGAGDGNGVLRSLSSSTLSYFPICLVSVEANCFVAMLRCICVPCAPRTVYIRGRHLVPRRPPALPRWVGGVQLRPGLDAFGWVAHACVC